MGIVTLLLGDDPTLEPASTTSAHTHLILPSWWVRAYEAASAADDGDESAMARACASGLAPVLNPQELNALGVVLDTLQRQILSGNHRVLTIRAEEHLKHASTTVRSRLFTFERIMQQLAGVRVLATPEQGQRRAFKLFASDAFLDGGDDGAAAVELVPTRLGPELLLGLADPHLDLVRLALGEPEAGTILGRQPPLGIWRSIWLELQQGLEQVLFLRMERGMQWDFRWLQLDGVFGLTLDELFQGLKVPESRHPDKLAELTRRLRVLDRLGKKLAAHGFLQPAQSDQYLAVDAREERSLELVWQMGRGRLATEAMTRYRSAAADFMLRHRFEDFGDAFHRLFLGPAPAPDALNAARAAWARLGAQSAPASAKTALSFRQTQPLLPQALFHEWRLRRQATGPLPLPEFLRSGPLAQLTAPDGDGDLEARFAAFCAYIGETPGLGRMLEEAAFATFASPLSKSSRELREHVTGLLTPQRAAVPPADEGGSARARADDAGGAARPDGSGARPGDGARPQFGSGASAALAKRAPDEAPEVAPRQAAVSGALASRMRKIASEELQKMQASAPDRFADLRRAFFSSIDPEQRKTIVDCQRTMPTTMFDEHLRHRLVRYMVENPGAWRTT